MNITIKAKDTTTEFANLKIGDVFQKGDEDMYHAYMKIPECTSTNDGRDAGKWQPYNAIDISENENSGYLVFFSDFEPVDRIDHELVVYG